MQLYFLSRTEDKHLKDMQEETCRNTFMDVTILLLLIFFSFSNAYKMVVEMNHLKKSASSMESQQEVEQITLLILTDSA